MSRPYSARPARPGVLMDRQVVLDLDSPEADSRSSAHATWNDFEAWVRRRGDVSGQRVAYLDGILEVLVPGENHETIKTNLARLIETWALEVDVELNGYGSWLLKNKRLKTGVEPDECYILGPRGRKQVPDIAVEVVWTRGGVEKLEIYRRLGVREVWIWEDGKLSAFVLKSGQWKQQAKSQLVPALDFELLTKFSTVQEQHRALKQFRALVTRH